MEYHDKVLKCSECNQEFVFTAGEQMFFADKGFKNEPKRCKDCKAKRSQNARAKVITSSGRKPKRPARSAERKLQFLSARRRGAPCSAGNASSSGGPWVRHRLRAQRSRTPRLPGAALRGIGYWFPLRMPALRRLQRVVVSFIPPSAPIRVLLVPSPCHS